MLPVIPSSSLTFALIVYVLPLTKLGMLFKAVTKRRSTPREVKRILLYPTSESDVSLSIIKSEALITRIRFGFPE